MSRLCRSLAILPLGAACLSLLLGCPTANQYVPPPVPEVTVARPLRQTVTRYLEETGTTEAVNRVDIRARVEGFLDKVEFDAGVEVQQGDLLYIIEQRPFLARVSAANAEVAARKSELVSNRSRVVALTVEFDRAETEYARQVRLAKRDATAEKNLVASKAQRDAAKAALAAGDAAVVAAAAAVDGAEAALDQANLDFEYTEIHAPIEGRVGKTLVKAGNLVGNQEATHLTTVIDYDPIYANFNINERALLELRDSLGDPRSKSETKRREEWSLRLRRLTDKGFPFEGKFDYADLAVDQSTGTFMIRGIFPNPKQLIVPGLFVQIRIPIGIRKDALLVPDLAVGSDQAGKYVLIVNQENAVKRRAVVIGEKYEHLVVALEGLTGEEQIVIEGIQRARPGVEVKPQLTQLEPIETEDLPIQQEDSPPMETDPEAAPKAGSGGGSSTDVPPDDTPSVPTPNEDKSPPPAEDDSKTDDPNAVPDSPGSSP